jgi:hypothetical protein
MAEYVIKEGEDHADVARRLLAESDDPNGVVWAPRPDTYGGGVYVVNNEETVAKVARDLQQARDLEAQRITDAQAAADERDAKADETGLTPAQLGFPANAGTDPGAPGTEGTPSEVDEDDDAETGESVEDDPATPEDESQMTPAQRRKAARQRKAQEDQANADAAKGDADASEEAK